MVVNDILLPVALATIMFGIGLSLDLESFKFVFKRPRGFVLGLSCQLLLLPAFAFFIAWMSGLPVEFQVGLVLISACPGGTTSNLLTYLFKGNTALSVSLTSVNSVIILLTIPLIVGLGLDVFMGQSKEISLPFWPTIWNVFISTLLPVACGVLVGTRYRETANKLEQPLKVILPLMMAAAFAYVIFAGDADSLSIFDYMEILPYALALNAGSMLLSFLIAVSMHVSNRNSFTIGIEVGLQNSALAIYIASSLLGNDTIALVAVLYSSFSFFTTALIAFVMKKLSRPQREMWRS